MRRSVVLPEFAFPKLTSHQYVAGDTITVYSSQTGDILTQYIYDGEFKIWMQVQE